MSQEKQTAEEKLKRKGITPLTKHHDYDYLYCSVVDILTEQAKEIENLRKDFLYWKNKYYESIN